MSVVMPVAPIPPPFARLEGRKLSFYPPILRVHSNLWTYRRATWSEIVVRNSVTGAELCISRRFLGECFEDEQGVIVIDLLEQLEFRDGAVCPQKRRVIEMPIAVSDAARTPRADHTLAPVIGIRLEPKPESRASRWAGGAVAIGVLGCLAVVGYSLQGNEAHRRAVVTSLDHTYLALSNTDTFSSVVGALGVPDSDLRVTTADGSRFRVLNYADRGFRAVLTSEEAGGRYLGSISDDGHILQAVLLPEGATSAHLLRTLPDVERALTDN